jgi:hypothetical protein
LAPPNTPRRIRRSQYPYAYEYKGNLLSIQEGHIGKKGRETNKINYGQQCDRFGPITSRHGKDEDRAKRKDELKEDLVNVGIININYLANLTRENCYTKACIIGVVKVCHIPATMNFRQLKYSVLLLNVMAGDVPSPKRCSEKKGYGNKIDNTTSDTFSDNFDPTQLHCNRKYYDAQRRQC